MARDAQGSHLQFEMHDEEGEELGLAVRAVGEANQYNMTVHVATLEDREEWVRSIQHEIKKMKEEVEIMVRPCAATPKQGTRMERAKSKKNSVTQPVPVPEEAS